MKALLLILIFGFLATGCSSSEKIDTTTAEGAYKLAEKYAKDERFEEALSYFSEVKNKHPYSNYATRAELRIAEIHFERESYPEAETAYRLFKEFHPRHEKIAYVTHQLGMSFFKQLPDSIDRDLKLADRAILYFDEVIRSHSASPWAEKAKEHKKKSLHMLAEKELYIANFYFIREKYQSALGRFEDLLDRYPGHFEKEALYGCAVSAHHQENITKKEKYLKELIGRYPKAPETSKAKDEVGYGS